MQHICATFHGLRPTVVAHEIGCGKREGVTGLNAALTHHRAHVRFARERTHGRAHAIALLQQLNDAVRADKARTAGD